MRSVNASLPTSVLDFVVAGGGEICNRTPNLVFTPSRILAEDKYVPTFKASSSLSFTLNLYNGLVVVNTSSSPIADKDTVYGIRNVFSKSNLDCKDRTCRVDRAGSAVPTVIMLYGISATADNADLK